MIPYNRDKTFWDKEHSDCNCMSYAFNLSEWYAPYDLDYEYERLDEALEMLEWGDSPKDIASYFARRDADEMKEIFGDKIRFINSLDEAAASDTVIAYRVMMRPYYGDLSPDMDTDFHFKLRKNGEWTEKCGMSKIKPTYCSGDEEIWFCSEDLIYNSETIFMIYYEEEI